jgi:hypothetical protein
MKFDTHNVMSMERTFVHPKTGGVYHSFSPVPGHLQIPRDLPDRLALDVMLAPNPADRLHCQHSPHHSLRIKASSASGQHSGGQFWTPIPRLRGRIASPGMLLNKFPPMTGATTPNRVGVVDGGKDQHGRAARGGVGGGGALPVGQAGGEGAHPHQIGRCSIPRECLHNLLRQPLCRRVPGHREPKQLSSTVAKDEKCKQALELDGQRLRRKRSQQEPV